MLLLLPLLYLFRHSLFGQDGLAYRDAAHYYQPLYEYVHLRWKTGLPLWNPLDGIGTPLWGDPTAAVIYPGKLIFWLPGPFTRRFAIYVVAHLWLAGVGMYWLARRFRCHSAGALLASLAYQLSGQVLFQYCNPIFAVGAAWLPWTLGFLHQGLLRPRKTPAAAASNRALIWASFALCLTILGGDAQQAYMTVIAAASMIWLRRSDSWPEWLRLQRDGHLRLIAAAALAGVLAAAQILPTMQWVQTSDRAIRDAPVSVWQWLAADRSSDAPDVSNASRTETTIPTEVRGPWMRAASDTHAAKTEQFSVGPWRWPELIVPNISGQLFPQYTRWLAAAVPAEGRTWTPSLYFGLLPFCLALLGLRWRRAPLAERWCTWLATVTVLAACGEYGIGWLLDEWNYQFGQPPLAATAWQRGLGGVYWWLKLLLPGFSQFRYPAKLWTLATLAFCLLAARQWRPCIVLPPRLAMISRQRVMLRRMLLSIVGLSGFGLLILYASRTGVIGWAAEQSPHLLFGPMQGELLFQHVTIAVWHSGLLAGLLIACLSCGAKFDRLRAMVPWCVLAICLGEITLAQRPLIQSSTYQRPSVTNANTQFAGQMPIVFHSGVGNANRLRYPADWEETSSPERLGELQAYDAQRLHPKYHLLAGQRSLRSVQSMTTAEYQAWWQVAGESEEQDKALVRSDDGSEDQERIHPGFAQILGAGRTNSSHGDRLPRAWLVHDWVEVSPATHRTHRELRAQTRHVSDILRLTSDDPNTVKQQAQCVAVVVNPSGETSPLARSQSKPGTENNRDLDDTQRPRVVPSSAMCEIVIDRPEHTVIRASTERPAILVVADQWDRLWQAGIRQANGTLKRQPLLQVNQVMRGVYLPEGVHTVELTYHPTSVYVGLWISGVGLVLAVGMLVIGGVDRRFGRFRIIFGL